MSREQVLADGEIDAVLREMITNGEAEAEFVNGEWTYKLTDKGLSSAAALIKDMTKGKDA